MTLVTNDGYYAPHDLIYRSIVLLFYCLLLLPIVTKGDITTRRQHTKLLFAPEGVLYICQCV